MCVFHVSKFSTAFESLKIEPNQLSDLEEEYFDVLKSKQKTWHQMLLR